MEGVWGGVTGVTGTAPLLVAAAPPDETAGAEVPALTAGTVVLVTEDLRDWPRVTTWGGSISLSSERDPSELVLFSWRLLFGMVCFVADACP